MANTVKELHRDALQAVWPNDQKMINYCLNKVSDYVILDDGSFITIDKPTIEKDFCFGYHHSRYDTESYDAAGAAAQNARENVNYFLKENLEKIDEYLRLLDDSDYVPAVRKEYWRSPEDSPLKALDLIERYKWNYELLYDKTKYRELSANELQNVKAGYKQARKKFEKRLQTYLKRYGLSKVNSWTYWLDE